MSGLDEWTRALLTPAQMPQRPRWLHWLAWLAAIVSFALLAVPLALRGDASSSLLVAQIDLGIAVFFALEFFTRSGWRASKWRYAVWRWFDFVAMVPILFIDQLVGVTAFFAWLVFAGRLVRMVDRTLGDGFVRRHLMALVHAVEEEVTDRVTLNIMARMEAELRQAQFGTAAAKALQENKAAFLQRIYAEQKPEGRTGRMAAAVGLLSALEKAEAKAYDAIVGVVGSPQADALVADLISQTLTRAREEIGRKSWKDRVGIRAEARSG